MTAAHLELFLFLVVIQLNASLAMYGYPWRKCSTSSYLWMPIPMPYCNDFPLQLTSYFKSCPPPPTVPSPNLSSGVFYASESNINVNTAAHNNSSSGASFNSTDTDSFSGYPGSLSTARFLLEALSDVDSTESSSCIEWECDGADNDVVDCACDDGTTIPLQRSSMIHSVNV